MFNLLTFYIFNKFMNFNAEFQNLMRNYFVKGDILKIGLFLTHPEKPCTKWRKQFNSNDTNFIIKLA